MNSKGIIRQLDSTGDTTVAEWDLTEVSLEKASAIFDEMVASGALLSRCDDGTDLTGQQITKFDPLADDIIVHPRHVGG